MPTRRNNNNNLIFQMNNENPPKPNQNKNKNKNKKRNNTKKVNRKLTIYANKYRNKPVTKEPYAPIDPNTVKFMNKYYKNTPF